MAQVMLLSFAVVLVAAFANVEGYCGRYDSPCRFDDQCCEGLKCNTMYNRCVPGPKGRRGLERHDILGHDETVPYETASCGHHGSICDSDAQCCKTTRCNKLRNRCEHVITLKEIMEQREKILGQSEPSTYANVNCGRQGSVCDSTDDCCENFKCNKMVNRCQIPISLEEVLEQREKVLKKLGLKA